MTVPWLEGKPAHSYGLVPRQRGCLASSFLVWLLLTACTQTPAITQLPEPTQPPPTEAAASATVDALPPTISAQAAYYHVQQLSGTIGSRPTGTPKERAAADYIAAEFAKHGYIVERPPVDFETYRSGSATLEVTNGTREEARPIEYSPGGEATGRLVAAGIGRPDQLLGRPLSGQIALVERGDLQFGEKVSNAAAAGAKGVVVYNNQSGDSTGWTMARLARIPAVAVSRETGLQLLDRATRGDVEVRITVDARQVKTESHNVIARTGSTCRVVVGGHYDSVAEGPGANDNASGTGVILEMARVLKAQGKGAGVCLMAFGGEELGLWGSRRYVEALSDDQKRDVLGMINLDMVGVGDVWRLSGSETLRANALAAADAEAVPIASFSSEDRRGGSDHASFLAAGIPSVFIHRRDDPNYHTAEDKAEFVDPASLETAGRLAIAIIDRLLGKGS